MKSRAEQLYHSQYRELAFERRELFALLAGELPVQWVLYPGSSIHITPSFCFNRVSYVDRSDEVAAFFADADGVNALIESNCAYARTPFWEFVHADVSHPLPFREGQFDLLLALYSGDAIRSCSRYVVVGGYAIADSDCMDRAATGSEWVHVHSVQYRKGRYVLLPPVAHTSGQRSDLQPSNRGYAYVDRQTYSILRKKG